MNPTQCPECGASIEAGQPCQQCLLRLGLADFVDRATEILAHNITKPQGFGGRPFLDEHPCDSLPQSNAGLRKPMSYEQSERVRQILAEVVNLPISERSRFLIRKCGSDGQLLQAIESLLAEDKTTL